MRSRPSSPGSARSARRTRRSLFISESFAPRRSDWPIAAWRRRSRRCRPSTRRRSRWPPHRRSRRNARSIRVRSVSASETRRVASANSPVNSRGRVAPAVPLRQWRSPTWLPRHPLILPPRFNRRATAMASLSRRRAPLCSRYPMRQLPHSRRRQSPKRRRRLRRAPTWQLARRRRPLRRRPLTVPQHRGARRRKRPEPTLPRPRHRVRHPLR